jgi:predicted DNA-binding transcriptional regulator YafY
MENYRLDNKVGSVSRLNRLLRLIQLLSSGVRRNIDEFSQILGVSRRTVFRDIEALEESGIRVHYEFGSKSYQIEEPFDVPVRPVLPGLLPLAVAIALRFLKRSPIDLAAGAAEIESVLMRQLSHSSATSFQAALNFVEVPPLASAKVASASHVQDLFAGFVSKRRVRLTYQSELGPQGTLLAPKKVVVEEEAVHIYGWSSFHRRNVHINVAEILTTELTDDYFNEADCVESSRLNSEVLGEK